MRKINKGPAKTSSKLLTPECQKKINESIDNIGKHTYSTAFYRDETVIKELENLYNSKCGFCESDTSAGSALQVEHYRPKDNLLDDTTHDGYYWLGYEWSNLTYACAKCNRTKWNYFPLKSTGKRVRSHPIDSSGNPDLAKFKINDSNLVGEKPLIINPEISDPSKHFIFTSSGRINARNNSEEGLKTIEKCGLNRDPLVLARKKIKDQLLKKCIKGIDDYNNGLRLDTFNYFIQDKLSDLIVTYKENKPYSVYALTVFKYFEYFIVKRFPIQTDRDLLINAYISFKSIAALP